MNKLSTPSASAIPANLEAERQTLGSILLDESAMKRIELKPSEFFGGNHTDIYAVMQELHSEGKPIEPTLLINRLAEKGLLDAIGGPGYITELITMTPTSLYIEHYAKIVHKTAEQRALLAAAQRIADLAYNGEDYDPVTARDTALGLITGAIPHKVDSKWVTMGDAVKLALNQLDPETRAMPISTGIYKLDRMLGGGLFPGRSYAVAGRPGMGKSSLMLGMALAAAQSGKQTALFSLEMSPGELAARALAMLTGVNGLRLTAGTVDKDEDIDKLMDAADVLSKLPLLLNPWTEAGGIFSACRALHADRGLDLVFIDYLQLVASSERTDRRDLEIAALTRKGKNLAKELGLSLVWGSQLSRKNEDRKDKRPELSDLRESGAIEQDQDVVIGLYRHEYYYPGESEGKAEAIVMKHRQGPTGTVVLDFEKRTTKFSDSRV